MKCLPYLSVAQLEDDDCGFKSILRSSSDFFPQVLPALDVCLTLLTMIISSKLFILMNFCISTPFRVLEQKPT